MTTVYFVRHAEPDYTNKNDLLRPLTQKGQKDTQLVSRFLQDKKIDMAFSSPFHRSYNTIKPFCDKSDIEIMIVDDFRERKISDEWISDFSEFPDFAKKQWQDFTYHRPTGENIAQVQNRNIKALNKILSINKNKNIIVASHGTALSTVVNYYCNAFGPNDFYRIKKLMPWVVKFCFEGEKCVLAIEYDLFTNESIEHCITR